MNKFVLLRGTIAIRILLIIIIIVKKGKYVVVFCVYHRSYLLLSPVIVGDRLGTWYRATAVTSIFMLLYYSYYSY